jgi:type IV pilus biogenesis protein PilP
MQVISRLAACAALVSSCAFAEPPAPAVPGGAPPTVKRPPAPPDLAPLSQDFQAAMANSQLQTYRYSQLTEQAQALKKLCDTGFGPADICPRGNAGTSEGAGSVAAADLPTVVQIDGANGALFAVLVLADGRRLTVHAGSVLPDGLMVAAITIDDVRIRMSRGDETALAFGDRGQAK